MVEKTTSFIIKNNIPDVVSGMSGGQVAKLGERIGMKFEKALVDRIKEGDSSWAPLSAAWAEKKGHDNPWYYTGRTEGAMEYVVSDALVRIGIVNDGEIASVATQLEYGTSQIPERPLFRPVYHENEEKIIKDASDWIKEQVVKGKL
ncbi:MAG: hypothetical protein U9Q37_00965 [Euryarchaeota archaeon]|nr:hypothetical protein [Euryarchaeota archaeon]